MSEKFSYLVYRPFLLETVCAEAFLPTLKTGQNFPTFVTI